jgi:hypothetical protein
MQAAADAISDEDHTYVVNNPNPVDIPRHNAAQRFKSAVSAMTATQL